MEGKVQKSRVFMALLFDFLFQSHHRDRPHLMRVALEETGKNIKKN